MKENDFDFINQVTEYYCSTIENGKGNISKVMEKFSISRTKATKILITSGAIDSQLHQDIMKLKDEGYDVDEIAEALNVSVTTVKTNMPYEKVIYNGEEKSAGATYTENFRARERVFMDNVVRKPTNLEIIRNYYQQSPQAELVKPLLGSLDRDWEENLVNLEPKFTEEESQLFKINPDIMLLHIELDEEVPEEDRERCGIRYGDTITRDIIAPLDMPLHNLHYAINQAFGFTNSHLHRYELTDKDYQWVTEGDPESWKSLIGLVFKNPIRDEEIDFWDDDYEGGSPKKWMRSKYTGPDYRKCYEEGYRYIRDEVENLKAQSRFGGKQYEVNETLELYNILTVEPKMTLDKWREVLDESLEEADDYGDMDPRSQPWVPSFAEKLIYFYDFGDSWRFTITPKCDVEELIRSGSVTEKGVKDAIKKVCTLARPVILAADGYPLVDDCGGVEGFVRMLKEIEDGDKETKNWAEGMGWKKKIDLNVL